MRVFSKSHSPTYGEGQFSEVWIPDRTRAYPYTRIFMHHHNMWVPLAWQEWPQKPSSRFSEGVLCKILHLNFGELTFHALG